MGYWIRIAADCIIPTYDNQRKYCTSATNEKWKEKDIDKRVDELLEMVGLEPEKYKTENLMNCQGQRQRVGVIRALAADPPVILMDEPFSALDPISREKLQDDLIELQTKIKKTIIFVTHDIQEAMKLGDKICL